MCLARGWPHEAGDFRQRRSLVAGDRQFVEVIDLKRTLQRKLLNELAATFLFRQAHLETVVSRFAEVIGQLPSAEQTQILNGIGATRSIIDELEARNRTIADQQREIEKTKGELAQAREASKAGLRTALKEKTTNLSWWKQQRTNLLTGSLPGTDSIFDSPVSSEELLATPSGSMLSGLFTSPSSSLSLPSTPSPSVMGNLLFTPSPSDWMKVLGRSIDNRSAPSPAPVAPPQSKKPAASDTRGAAEAKTQGGKPRSRQFKKPSP